jgi:hypothetical protein
MIINLKLYFAVCLKAGKSDLLIIARNDYKSSNRECFAFSKLSPSYQFTMLQSNITEP